jgi:hypothetical protein
VRKLDEATDRGANAVKALCAGLDVAPPGALLGVGKAGLKEGGGGLADGGGRGGREDGGCAVLEEEGEEEALRPGGGGQDMMNCCAEEKADAISDVPIYCKQGLATAP